MAALHCRSKGEKQLSSSDEGLHEDQLSTVLITGTTGNFGSYLLDHVISQPWTGRIICLNRSPNARSRQLDSHKERGLSVDFSDVSFYQADFNNSQLGLTGQEYQHLASSGDLFVHNAWPVDFNRNFRSFKPSMDGIQHIVNFCMARREKPIKLLFVSSIGATSNWGSAAPTSRSKIPEVELTDWKVARTGYGQSKLVAERLLSHASRAIGLPVSIIRVGQLSGPVLHGAAQGNWTEREWLPSLIRSSISLRALPENLGPIEDIDWVPVDLAAVVMSELCLNLVQQTRDRSSDARFFHLVNPHCTQWSTLVPSIMANMDSSVRCVKFVEWVTMLKQGASTADGFRGVDEGSNPAAKLIDFFDNLQDRAIRFPKAKTTLLDTKETVKVSKTLASLKPVDEGWMSLWMRQWKWTLMNNAAERQH